jgi:methylglutaconyl-CoA hydratase
MSAEPVVITSEFDRIATIVLNRPEKKNAMDGVVVKELLQAFQHVAQNKSVRVVVLKAHGENFCAGGDIAWMQKMAASSQDENVADATQLALLMHVIYTFPKPVVVLAQGATFGGGLGLIAAGDIVIASHDASFAFSEVKIGITPSVISPYVIAAIGERAARYYFLTAMRFSVNEAHHMGLVHQIVESEALTSTGLEVARALLTLSPTALSEAKSLVQHIARQPISKNLIQITAEHLARLRTSAEANEGLNAFLEKRSPQWS